MRIAIQYHDDSDGKAASRIMMEYLNNEYPNAKVDFYHGSAPIIPVRYDMYIFLDMGTRALKFIAKAYGKRGTVWVFDHHLPVQPEKRDVDLFVHSPRGKSTSQLVYEFYRREVGPHPRMAFIAAIGGVKDGYKPTKLEFKDASEKYEVREAPAYKGLVDEKLKNGLIMASSNIPMSVIEGAPDVKYNEFDCDSYPEVCERTIVFKHLPIYSYMYHRRKGIKMVPSGTVENFRVVIKTDDFVLIDGSQKALIMASNHVYNVPVIGRFTKGFIVASARGDAYAFASKYTDNAYGRDIIAFMDFKDIGKRIKDFL